MPTVEEMRIIMDTDTARMASAISSIDRRLGQFERAAGDKLKRFDAHFRRAGMAAAALGAGLGVRDVLDYANAWTRTERALRASEDVFGIQLTTTEKMSKLASDARIDLEAYGKVYIRTAAAIRDFGYTEVTAQKVTSSLAMALKLGSAAASEQSSVLLQFSQALQKGKLDGDEFRSVMENAGVVQELLARRLRVSKGEIINMAREGKLKVQDLVGAMVEGHDAIERIFRRTPATIDESMIVLRNALTQYVAHLDQSTGASRRIVDAITGVANNMRAVGDGAMVAAAGLLAAFAPRVIGAVGALGVGLAGAITPLGLVAAIVGGGAVALTLFGDQLQMAGAGMVTLRDYASAAMDVIGAQMTPMLDQASAAWQTFAATASDALAGLPIDMEMVVGAARAAANLTIGLFKFAVRNIATVFTGLPGAVGEQMIAMANRVLEIVEGMVRSVVRLLNTLPGINIDPNVDVGRFRNALDGATRLMAERFKANGRELGRDHVGEIVAGMDEMIGAVRGRAEQIAAARAEAARESGRAGALTRLGFVPTRGKPPVDKGLEDQMKRASEQIRDLHAKALEATGRHREAVVMEYQSELAKFKEMLDKKLISQQQFEFAREQIAITAGQRMADATEKEWERLRTTTDAVASGMEDAFSKFVETGKFSFSDLARSVLADIAKIAFKMAVIGPLFGSQGKGFGIIGSIIGGLTGTAPSADFTGGAGLGTRASGGPVRAGTPYIVGERGRELFVPNVSGNVIAHAAAARMMQPSAGGAGGEVVVTVAAGPELLVTIDNRAQGVVARTAPQIVGQAVRSADKAFPDMMRKHQQRSRL